MNKTLSSRFRIWLYVVGGLTGALLLLAWAFAPRPLEVEVAQVGRGALETSIEEDGKTRVRDRYVVSAPLAGHLARTSLREGDAVAAQSVVAAVMPMLPAMLDERALRELRARVEMTDAQVQRSQARIEGAKVVLLKARSELERSEQLARQGFVSSTKLEADHLALKAAQQELDAAVQERHVARHEGDQARAALTMVSRPRVGAGQRGFDVRAPTEGRVLRVLQTSETAVALGTPLLEIGDTGNLEVVAELLTTDALRTPPGSLVHIEHWGGEPLGGKVRRVEPAAFTKVSALGVEEQRVKVLIDITSPPRQWQALGDGFRVGVRIVTLAVNDVVKAPASALFPVPQGMAVFRVQDGRARLTKVVVGARNTSDAWIRQGLEPGDTVVVYPPGTMADGARVKVRKV